MPVPVVALYGSFNAFLNIALALYVSRLRTTHKVSLGTGDSREVLHAVRMHGNSAEFVPLAIVMLLIAELSGGAPIFLHALGASLSIGRVLHIIGIPKKAPNPYRVLGNAATWLMIMAASGYCLFLAARS